MPNLVQNRVKANLIRWQIFSSLFYRLVWFFSSLFFLTEPCFPFSITPILNAIPRWQNLHHYSFIRWAINSHFFFIVCCSCCCSRGKKKKITDKSMSHEDDSSFWTVLSHKMRPWLPCEISAQTTFIGHKIIHSLFSIDLWYNFKLPYMLIKGGVSLLVYKWWLCLL